MNLKTLLILSDQGLSLDTKDSLRYHHLTLTSPLLGELTFTLSNLITSLPMIGVLRNFNYLNNHSLTFLKIYLTILLKLNYPSKGNQTNIRYKTPFIAPHLTNHISSSISLNPNFIM